MEELFGLKMDLLRYISGPVPGKIDQGVKTPYWQARFNNGVELKAKFVARKLVSGCLTIVDNYFCRIKVCLLKV
ncbi:MAG: hypothetical protein LBJ61_11725 [Deltaproteobacteria bacterium]|jgi:hypothetical protein|nr:hypothetical protein [Deltaproteobacteria bacterium]